MSLAQFGAALLGVVAGAVLPFFLRRLPQSQALAIQWLLLGFLAGYLLSSLWPPATSSRWAAGGVIVGLLAVPYCIARIMTSPRFRDYLIGRPPVDFADRIMGILVLSFIVALLAVVAGGGYAIIAGVGDFLRAPIEIKDAPQDPLTTIMEVVGVAGVGVMFLDIWILGFLDRRYERRRKPQP